MKDEIRLADGAQTRVIRNCLPKLQSFCRFDAFPWYDLLGYRHLAVPDRIQCDLLDAMNSAMRARSSRTAWMPFLDKQLPQLAAVSADADLVESSDDAYLHAREQLRSCYSLLTDATWITDMAASKMLYLKRPKLVAISDSYVRQALGVRQPDWRQYPMRGPFYAERALLVADAVRAVGTANLDALSHLQTALSPTLQEIAHKHGVQSWISKARMLDILIWISMAIGSHKQWAKWADENGWSAFG